MSSLPLKMFSRVPSVGDLSSFVLAKKYFGPDVVSADQRPLSRSNLLLLGSVMGYVDGFSVVCGAGLIGPRRIPCAPAAVVLTRGPLIR